ncbi:MAG: radical SAM protein [Lachnospiraceae bacterium]|nr:radical SAM protein [Lachnospiraceae bacterium]
MQFTIWITYDCNLKCSYCYEGNEKRSTKLSFENAEKILAFIQQKAQDCTDTISINLYGGEPLLNYDVFCFIVNTIKKWDNRHLAIFTTTNGTLLDDEKIEFLTGNLTELSLSIDGEKGTHDKCRKYKNGSGTFDDIIPFIPQLLSKSRNIVARLTVTPDNAENLANNIKFLYKQGFNKIVPVIDQYDPRWNHNYMKTLIEELKKVIDQLYVESKDILVGMIEEVGYRKSSLCLAGTKTMHFSPDGDIYPCAHVMGYLNLKIGDVINGIDSNKVREIQALNGIPIESCKGCSWIELCHGARCKLMNYAVSKCYDPPFSACMNERVLLEVHKYYRQNILDKV